MDRREALKKMMAGGAVIAGASMVSSSPVFAAGSVGSGQPVVPGMTTPPPPGAIANDKRSNTWLFTAPTGTCSSGAAPQVMSYATVGPMSPNLNVMMTPFGGYAAWQHRHVDGHRALARQLPIPIGRLVRGDMARAVQVHRQRGGDRLPDGRLHLPLRQPGQR